MTKFQFKFKQSDKQNYLIKRKKFRGLFSENRYKTNLELRAAQREENRKIRQAQMLEEQKRVEERLLNIRLKSKPEPVKKLARTVPKNVAKSSSVAKPKNDSKDANTSFDENQEILRQLQQIQNALLRKQQKLLQK